MQIYLGGGGRGLCLHGPATDMPIAARSKKQTSVSHSALEADIVSLDFGIRFLALPALDLWETVFNRDVDLEVLEDNEVAIQIVNTVETQAGDMCREYKEYRLHHFTKSSSTPAGSLSISGREVNVSTL